jgi:hypothetical protein
MMRSSIFLLAVLAGLALGCGPDVQALQEEAQAALDRRDLATAATRADAGIAAAKGDRATAWRFEQVRLEALARGGKGAEVQATLERLAGSHAAQVQSPLFLAAAGWLKEAGDTKGAVDLLIAGDARFPADHERFQAAITQMSQTQELAPADVERLRSLGYL